MNKNAGCDTLVVFESTLGWLAVIGYGSVLKYLTLGHSSAGAARKALEHVVGRKLQVGEWNQRLVERLRAYTEGSQDDFLDVRVDPGPLSDFRRRVVRACRKIPYGQTLTYGALAARSGSPSAARAAGRCMAANRIPLVIPCHRVVAVNGHLGGYSAPGGVRLKRKLLDLEAGTRVD
jgi:methylated-DNA-[protein]-cysteine S-methyltransferase